MNHIQFEKRLDEFYRNKGLLNAKRRISSRFSDFYEWNNQLAIQRVEEMTEEIGIKYQYAHSDKSPDGFVIWIYPLLKNGMQYKQIKINDTAILHLSPDPHYDFFDVTVEMVVPTPEKAGEIMSISTSISIHRGRNEVSAGCHFLGAGIYTLYLVKLVNEGKISAETARGMYGHELEELVKEQSLVDNRRDGDPIERPLSDMYHQYVLGFDPQLLPIYTPTKRPDESNKPARGRDRGRDKNRSPILIISSKKTCESCGNTAKYNCKLRGKALYFCSKNCQATYWEDIHDDDDDFLSK